MKIFRNEFFALALFGIIQDSLDYVFKIEMSQEKVNFIKKNENNCNFCSIAYFAYYML